MEFSFHAFYNFWKLKWQDCLISSQLSLRENKSHSTRKRSRVLEFMFLDINKFWALLRAHFNPRLAAWANMSLSRAQNIFMTANINSIV